MNFPYPVKYFDGGKTTDLSPDKLHAQLKKVRAMDEFAGPVLGDTGIQGLKLDFNSGLRLQVPAGDWEVTIRDYLTEKIFLAAKVTATVLISLEKYYIPWQIDVRQGGQLVFSHRLALKNQRVRFVCFSGGALGDFINFLPYVTVFRNKHQANVYVSIFIEALIPLTKLYMPEVPLNNDVLADTYATFYFISGHNAFTTMPLEAALVPLWHMPRLSLGLREDPPLRSWPRGRRLIPEPYVCIGVQASSAAKGWLWPGGWDEVVRFLKNRGYRVLCIDAVAQMETHGIECRIPADAEDFTGFRPLTERGDMLRHAELFIGLSSGLSWLAHLAGCPVIVIGGFTAYWHEFPAAYRVYNAEVCNGCANDPRVDYYEDFFCPKHKGDPAHELECNKKISPKQVINAIKEILSHKHITGVQRGLSPLAGV